MATAPSFITRADLARYLSRLGLQPGDTVMVHAAISRVGPLLGGPDCLIRALLDVVGPDGTIMAYTDWDAGYEDLLDEEGCVPEAWRDAVPPFDARTSRAVRDNGILAEFIRTSPGAMRSGNPGASVAALGARADWLTRDHALDYGYGPASPFARLVEAGGRVLMVGAPFDTMTLLHHAEHLADIPGKRIVRKEVPFAENAGTVWRMMEEFDTAQPTVAGLEDDYFADVVDAWLSTGQGRRGRIGEADSLLVEAVGIVPFAVAWLEERFGSQAARTP